MKTTTLFLLPVLLAATTATAQVVGSDAYIKGTLVEIGIDGSGGFEGVDQSTSPPPAGMHARTTFLPFGFIANPQNNAWATFDGDFFTPGSPENGWGFEMDTISASNNCGSFGTDEIPGALTSWAHTGTQTLVDWEGDYTAGTNLHFKINYELGDTNLFYITTVSVTNNTADTIPELYYYRNLDPDNNEEINFDFSTANKILSQPYGGGNYAAVEAAQADGSYFAFITDTVPGWRAAYGGFSNRDAADLWNGTGTMYAPSLAYTPGDSLFWDCAIAVSYKLTGLLPGSTGVFKFCTTFDPESADAALAAMHNDVATGINGNSLNASTIVYPNPFTDVTTVKVGNDLKLVNAKLVIFDITGREVKRISEISTNEIKIDRKGLPEGIYFYRLINSDKEMITGKLIIK